MGEIVHLGYPDGYLTPSLELRRDIVRQIRRFRPDLVIAQNSQRRSDGNPFIAHPDHLATGEATMSAVYPAARDRLNFPELLEEGLEPWKARQVLVTGVEHPNLWVDVAAQMDIALAALEAMPARSATGRRRSSGSASGSARRGEPVGLEAAQAFLSILLT